MSIEKNIEDLSKLCKENTEFKRNIVDGKMCMVRPYYIEAIQNVLDELDTIKSRIRLKVNKCERKLKNNKSEISKMVLQAKIGTLKDVLYEEYGSNTKPHKCTLENLKNKNIELIKENEELRNQVKMLDEAYSGAIKESKRWFDIAKDSVPKDKIRCISSDIEYLWMGNLRYKDSQRVFEILLKKLKEILGD